MYVWWSKMKEEIENVRNEKDAFNIIQEGTYHVALGLKFLSDKYEDNLEVLEDLKNIALCVLKIDKVVERLKEKYKN